MEKMIIKDGKWLRGLDFYLQNYPQATILGHTTNMKGGLNTRGSSCHPPGEKKVSVTASPLHMDMHLSHICAIIVGQLFMRFPLEDRKSSAAHGMIDRITTAEIGDRQRWKKTMAMQVNSCQRLKWGTNLSSLSTDGIASVLSVYHWQKIMYGNYDSTW
ncbi:hypothetical protein GW17_00013424 [Ensete ventricosum]|nr:hypothetical protein GW17_00013424 [Ensete ventricosum]RZR96775.1 hypothetical protein BHM03_00025839 [Ensete ventricosum]